jgi:transposase-like protein
MKFSKEEKAMRLEDWKQSGKSPWTYARENGLVPQTFASWTKVKREKNPGFVEMPIESMTGLIATEILIEKGDIKIHVPISLGNNGLRLALEGLGSLS